MLIMRDPSRLAKVMEWKVDSLATRTGKSSMAITIILMVLSLSAWIIFLTGFAMRNHWTVAELDKTFEHEFFCWWGLVIGVPMSCLTLLLYTYCCHILLGVAYFLLAQLTLVFAGGVVNINAQRIIGYYDVEEEDEYFNKFVVLEFSAAIIFIIFQMVLILVLFLFLFRGLTKLSSYVHYSQFGRDLHYNPIDD